MTVSSTTSRWEYDGDGTTKIFPYTNKIFADSDLEVYVDGTLQTLNTDYTVSGEGTTAGGNVTFTNAPDQDTEVVIVRNVKNTQEADYPAGGNFSSTVTEDAFDRRTIVAQQLEEKIARALKQPVGEAVGDMDLPALADRASAFLAFDSDGDPIAAAGTAGPDAIVVSDFMATVLDDTTGEAAYATLGAYRDADEDTKIQVEETADEDIIRFDTGGLEALVLQRVAESSADQTVATFKALEDANNVYVDVRNEGTGVGTGAGFRMLADDSAGNETVVGQIAAEASDLTDASEDADLICSAVIGGTLTEILRMRGRQLLVGDSTSNGNMTVGLTINQGDNDDEALALKSNDIDHNLASLGDDNTFVSLKKRSGIAGGLIATILAENTLDNVASFQAFGGAPSAVPSTTAAATIEMIGSPHDGAGSLTNYAANSLVFGVAGQVGGATRRLFFVDEDGDLHVDGSSTPGTFDRWDDAALARAFDLQLGDPAQLIRSKWDEYVAYGRDALIRAGILSDPKDGGDPMVCITQLQRLHNGAIWQLHTGQLDLRNRLERRIDRLARRLTAVNKLLEARHA